ncbi:putative nuclease HARBI1-like protein, partial [Calocera cornea HHB12733]
HTSIRTGAVWVEELLQAPPSRIRETLGMHKHVFIRLCTMLCTVGGLRPTRFIGVTEQLALFLVAVRKGESNRGLQELFQRSGDTVSQIFHRILRLFTMPAIYNAYVRLPENQTPPELELDPKMHPFFKDCLAAIDGSHITAIPPTEERARFRNRKGQLSLNVLAACTFDMRFCYILSGWEGSIADCTLFDQAHGHDLAIPEGKYYLADAGFSHCDALLVPYRGVRYHLREWALAQSGRRPANAKELFNLRHSQARNVIERAFGIFKKRFRIIQHGSEYPIATQAQIVPACAVIHNFIRTHDAEDIPELDAEEEVDLLTPREVEGTRGRSADRGALARANRRRDTIADAMWASY